MPIQDYAPSRIVSSANMTNVTLAALSAQDADWALATANNVATEIRVGYPTPPNPLRTGPELQIFTVQARKFGGTGVPTFQIQLFVTGGGSPIATSAPINVPATGGSIFTWNWDASLLGANPPSSVEHRVITSPAGGGPSARATIEYGFMQWTADFLDAPVFNPNWFMFFDHLG